MIVQEPATCRAPSMPMAVIRDGHADFVLPPEEIAEAGVTLAVRRAAVGLDASAACVPAKPLFAGSIPARASR